MTKSHDEKQGELKDTEKRPEQSSGESLEDVLGKGFASMMTDNGGGGDLGSQKLGSVDDLMAEGKKGRLGLYLFLGAMAVVVCMIAYVLVDPIASMRVASFLRGDLLKLDRQKTEDLARQYDEKVALLQEKTGNIMLQYFPPSARVTMIQQAYVLETIDAKEKKVFGSPVAIDNDSLHLKADEELPELNIQNLPIRERGKLCITDGNFYPASRMVCPGWEKCLASAIPEEITETEEVAEGEEGKEGDAKKEAKPAEAEAKKPAIDCNQYFSNPKIFSSETYCEGIPSDCRESCDCYRNTLRVVDFCPDDSKYYPALSGMLQRCPGSDTIMDPTKVPMFIYDYNFVFENDDYLPSVVSYTEENWKSLGSGRYVILFPKDFSLLRDWVPVLEKFAKASKAIRCWDRVWEDKLISMQKEKVLAAAREAMAEKAKDKEKKEADLKARKLALEQTINEIGALRKVKKMATVVDGRGEIFWFCTQKGQCEEANLETLKKEDIEAYYGVLALMDPMGKLHPEALAEVARRPVLKAGITCLDKWMPLQSKVADKTAFVKVEDKDCTAAMEAVRGTSPEAYQALIAEFVDANANRNVLSAEKISLASYFKSREEYGEGTAPSYDDMIVAAEAGAKHVDFMIKLYLFEPDTFETMLESYVKSRLANHLAEAQKNNFYPDQARGLKETLDLAWWIGKPVFDRVYTMLWEQDVQACLLYVKDRDPARFEVDRKRFQELMAMYYAIQKEHEAQASDFRVSLPKFRQMLRDVAEARDLLRRNKAAFDAKFGPVLASTRPEDLDVQRGLLLATNPMKVLAAINEMGKLPAPKEGEEPGKEGDQKQYHKYLAYNYFLSKAKLDAGIKLLEKRVQPFFMNEAQYKEAFAAVPDALSYKDAISELINYDIPLKYFWLIALFDNQTRFDRELARLDKPKAIMISRSLDPERYKYLQDLVWLEQELNRDTDLIPSFQTWTTIDRSMLEAEKQELSAWTLRKAAVERKFKRSKAATAWLMEPTMVERALDTSLKSGDRYAMLMNNIETYEESKVIEVAGDIVREEGQAVIEELAGMWKKFGETGNQTMRSHYGFTEARWSPLVDEVRISFPKWYTFLDEGLRNKRSDCRQPEPLKKYLDCALDNAFRATANEAVADCNQPQKGINLP